MKQHESPLPQALCHPKMFGAFLYEGSLAISYSSYKPGLPKQTWLSPIEDCQQLCSANFLQKAHSGSNTGVILRQQEERTAAPSTPNKNFAYHKRPAVEPKAAVLFQHVGSLVKTLSWAEGFKRKKAAP